MAQRVFLFASGIDQCLGFEPASFPQSKEAGARPMGAGDFLGDVAEAAKLPAIIFKALFADQHMIALAIPCPNQPGAWLECNFWGHSSQAGFCQFLLQF